MSIYFEKAKELGELILKSEQSINLADATSEFNKDTEAKKKFDEYKSYQSDIQKKLKGKEITQEEFKNASKKLTEMAIELKQIPSIAALTFAENEFNSFVNEVMNILKLTITGKELNSSSGGCCGSGGCGGCSGCN